MGLLSNSRGLANLVKNPVPTSDEGIISFQGRGKHPRVYLN